jgi:hypothetical protein
VRRRTTSTARHALTGTGETLPLLAVDPEVDAFQQVALPTPVRVSSPFQCRLTDQRAKLALGPTAPDAELLAGLDREAQAALLNRAPGTVRGRLLLAACGAGKELLLVLDGQVLTNAPTHPAGVEE